MKLSDWAKKQGIAYLTAYRWFKDGKLPVQGYQSDSGTIIVQDDSENSEIPMASTGDAMSIFLKKTVEFSKNNSTIEDFAAYIISNFTLKLNNINEPLAKYSKNKPKTEDVQKHFAQFIPDKNNIDHLKHIKSLIKEKPGLIQDNLDFSQALEEAKLVALFENETKENLKDSFSGALKDLNNEYTLSEDPMSEVNESLDTTSFGGIVARNVEFVSTPQQTNYTGSTSTIASGNLISQDSDGFKLSIGDCALNSAQNSTISSCYYNVASNDPPLKDIETVNVPKRRGRKPSKNLGKK